MGSEDCQGFLQLLQGLNMKPGFAQGGSEVRPIRRFGEWIATITIDVQRALEQISRHKRGAGLAVQNPQVRQR